MSLRDALADVQRAGDSAGYIFLNPPTSTPVKARDRAAVALVAVARASRLPRHPALDRDRVADAAVAADRAANAVACLAWSSSDDADRVVLLAPSLDLARAASGARLALAPDDVALALAHAHAVAAHAVAVADARRVAGY